MVGRPEAISGFAVSWLPLQLLTSTLYSVLMGADLFYMMYGGRSASRPCASSNLEVTMAKSAWPGLKKTQIIAMVVVEAAGLPMPGRTKDQQFGWRAQSLQGFLGVNLLVSPG